MTSIKDLETKLSDLDKQREEIRRGIVAAYARPMTLSEVKTLLAEFETKILAAARAERVSSNSVESTTYLSSGIPMTTFYEAEGISVTKDSICPSRT